MKYLGASMVSVATVRLLDCMLAPPALLPWWFYAALFAIGVGVHAAVLKRGDVT